jgi:hypothetical protein
VAAIGGILFGIGTLLAGLADQMGSSRHLYLGFGLIAGLGNGFGYVTPIATLIRWFPDTRGLVTGLAVMGFGLGHRRRGGTPGLCQDEMHHPLRGDRTSHDRIYPGPCLQRPAPKSAR